MLQHHRRVVTCVALDISLTHSSYLSQVYFALLLYSFCSHLRLNTYRALPLTNLPASASAPNTPHTGSSSRRASKMAMLPKNADGGVADEEFNWDSEDDDSTRGRTGPRGDSAV